MKTIFYKTRHDLTNEMIRAMKQGFVCYRVRAACQCTPINNNELIKYPDHHERNAVLFIKNNRVRKLGIRCKNCATNAGNLNKWTFAQICAKLTSRFFKLKRKPCNVSGADCHKNT